MEFKVGDKVIIDMGDLSLEQFCEANSLLVKELESIIDKIRKEESFTISHIVNRDLNETEIYLEEFYNGGLFIYSDFLELVDTENNSKEDWNIKCPICNSPAYQGFIKIECSRGCNNA